MRLSSRTSNALNALVLSEQVRFKQTSETVCTDGRIPDEIWDRVPESGTLSQISSRNPDFGAGNWKGPTAVSEKAQYNGGKHGKPWLVQQAVAGKCSEP